jgi:hypothetical protein
VGPDFWHPTGLRRLGLWGAKTPFYGDGFWGWIRVAPEG